MFGKNLFVEFQSRGLLIISQSDPIHSYVESTKRSFSFAPLQYFFVVGVKAFATCSSKHIRIKLYVEVATKLERGPNESRTVNVCVCVSLFCVWFTCCCSDFQSGKKNLFLITVEIKTYVALHIFVTRPKLNRKSLFDSFARMFWACFH